MVESRQHTVHRGGYCGLQGAQWQGREGQPANCTITIQQKMLYNGEKLWVEETKEYLHNKLLDLMS